MFIAHFHRAMVDGHKGKHVIMCSDGQSVRRRDAFRFYRRETPAKVDSRNKHYFSSPAKRGVGNRDYVNHIHLHAQTIPIANCFPNHPRYVQRTPDGKSQVHCRAATATEVDSQGTLKDPTVVADECMGEEDPLLAAPAPQPEGPASKRQPIPSCSSPTSDLSPRILPAGSPTGSTYGRPLASPPTTRMAATACEGTML